jgi:hypothetical protein
MKTWIIEYNKEVATHSSIRKNQRAWLTFFKTGKAPADAPGYIKKAQEMIEWINMDRWRTEIVEEYDRLMSNLAAKVAYEYQDRIRIVEQEKETAVQRAERLERENAELRRLLAAKNNEDN